MLGNFGAAPITADESWVTDSEFVTGGKKSDRGERRKHVCFPREMEPAEQDPAVIARLPSFPRSAWGTRFFDVLCRRLAFDHARSRRRASEIGDAHAEREASL